MSGVSESARRSDTLVVEEHSDVGPFSLTDADYRMLDTVVNPREAGSTRVGIRHTREGDAYLKTTAFVGIVSLPDGPTLQIEPKVRVENLLRIIRYAFGSDLSILETTESLRSGGKFVDIIAAVYLDELDDVLAKGLENSYVRKDGTERYLKGKLDTHRQLQRSPIAPVTFECTYDDLTHDTPLNRVILRATKQLANVVLDAQLATDLQERSQRLEEQISDVHVTSALAEQIELNRLNSHYETIHRLATNVLNHTFISDLARGSRTSYSMLIDMNDVFEKLVERAAMEVAKNHEEWTIEAQASSESLLRGPSTVRMYPDIVFWKSGEPIVVADTKCKTSRQNADLYQVLAYQSSYDVPGILFYPSQGGSIESRYQVKGGSKLDLVELPVNPVAMNTTDFVKGVESKVEAAVSRLQDDGR